MSDKETKVENVAPMSGFVFGFIGAAIRKVVAIGDKEVKQIVGYRFDAVGTDANGKSFTVASYDEVEAPYPTTDEAAKKMAKDCRFTIVRRVEGKIIETKLAGLPAAVAIARNGRPVETLRGRVRNRKISESQLREAARSLYGFSAGDVPTPEVSADDLARILSDEPSVAVLDDDGEPAMEVSGETNEDGEAILVPILRVATAAEKLDAMAKMLAANGVTIK